MMRLAASYGYQPFRISVGKRAQSEGVHGGEDCAVRSNSKSQGKNSNRHEAWIFSQHAECVADILHQSLKHWQTFQLAIRFLKLGDTAQSHVSDSVRFCRRHSAPNVFVRQHFQMPGKLLSKFSIFAPAGNPRANF